MQFAVKVYTGVAVYLQHIKLRHHMEVSGQILAPATLPPRTDPRCPANTTLAESRSGRFEKRDISQGPSWNRKRFLGHTACSLNIIPTVLP